MSALCAVIMKSCTVRRNSATSRSTRHLTTSKPALWNSATIPIASLMVFGNLSTLRYFEFPMTSATRWPAQTGPAASIPQQSAKIAYVHQRIFIPIDPCSAPTLVVLTGRLATDARDVDVDVDVRALVDALCAQCS